MGSQGGRAARYKITEGGYWDETSSILEDRRARHCRERGRSAGHRAIEPGDQMAHDGQLAEVARHAVRRCRRFVERRRGGHRQQVPDPSLRRRRNRAGSAGARRRVKRHGRDGPHRLVLLFRQGSDLRLRHLRCVRPEPAPEPGLVLSRRRQRSAQRVLQEVQRDHADRRQHRLPDGRLVPQGDQYGRRSQGPEIPHRRIPRASHRQARRRAAVDRGRRHLSVAGEGHDRRRRVGRPL